MENKKHRVSGIPDTMDLFDSWWNTMQKNCKWGKEESQKALEQLHFKTWTFPQWWGSTALGFDAPGTIGGCAMTEAQTTIFFCKEMNIAGVFFDGRPAYMVISPSDKFWEDVNAHKMETVTGAKKTY